MKPTFRPHSLANSTLSTGFRWRRGWAFEVALAETARALTEGASPLVGSPRRRHIPRVPPVRIPPSLFFVSLQLLQLIPQHSSLNTDFHGGEGGIRTHGPIAGTHAFQACRFDHSRTSPNRFSRGGILTRGLITGKVTTGAHRHDIDPPDSPSHTTKKSRGGAAMRILTGQGILVVHLVTAIILSASTLVPFSHSSRFFHRLSVAE